MAYKVNTRSDFFRNLSFKYLKLAARFNEFLEIYVIKYLSNNSSYTYSSMNVLHGNYHK